MQKPSEEQLAFFEEVYGPAEELFRLQYVENWDGHARYLTMVDRHNGIEKRMIAGRHVERYGIVCVFGYFASLPSGPDIFNLISTSNLTVLEICVDGGPISHVIIGGWMAKHIVVKHIDMCIEYCKSVQFVPRDLR